MRMRKRSLTMGVLGVAVLLSGCGLHGKPKVERKSRTMATAAGAPSARSAELVADTTGADVVAPGVVEPWGAQVELAAQESGWIARIVVSEGAVVEAGQLLATLEDAAQQDAVQLAQAQRAAAEAALIKVEHGATAEELRQVQADYAAAQARSTFARSAAARTARLHRDGTVPDNEAERVSADAQAQTALAQRAQARLQELQRGARPEDRSAARANARAAYAALQLAKDNLSRRRIAAPASGTVLLSRFHAGEFYSPQAGPLFILGDMSRLQVRLEVDEIDARDVRAGAPCAVYSDGGSLLTRGTIVRLAPRMGRRGLSLESPTARADVRVREVFVEIPAASKLVPGQRVWGHTARSTSQEKS